MEFPNGHGMKDNRLAQVIGTALISSLVGILGTFTVMWFTVVQSAATLDDVNAVSARISGLQRDINQLTIENRLTQQRLEILIEQIERDRRERNGFRSSSGALQGE